MEDEGRKRVRTLLILSLIIVIGLCTIISGSSAPKGGTSGFAYGDVAGGSYIDSSKLEEGDVLLRRGRGFVSSLIAGASGASVSHCGIVVKDEGKWQVIHSISGHLSQIDGVRQEALELFLREAQPGTLFHAKPRFELDRQAVADICKEYRDRALGFDHMFDLDEMERLYCSELVRAAYLGAGAPDLFVYTRVAGKELIDMASFFDAKCFEIQ